jgi:hypothetical protein
MQNDQHRRLQMNTKSADHLLQRLHSSERGANDDYVPAIPVYVSHSAVRLRPPGSILPESAVPHLCDFRN